MKRTLLIISAGIASLVVLKSCAYHDLGEITTIANTDESLFDEINAAGFEYYQSGDLLSPVSPSPHGKFRLKYNDIMISSLDPSGELPTGAAMKSGAIVVKEIYNDLDELQLYAVIKKAPGDANAQSGQLWAEYALDGEPLISIEGKGAACVDCHASTPNRDRLKTFDLH
jgi:hypothetical protein